jgi:hypothetical protein
MDDTPKTAASHTRHAGFAKAGSAPTTMEEFEWTLDKMEHLVSMTIYVDEDEELSASIIWIIGDYIRHLRTIYAKLEQEKEGDKIRQHWTHGHIDP